MIERNVVLMPQVSINDETAVLVEWKFENGSRLKKGDIIGSAETTKAIIDIESEFDGYFFAIAKQESSIAIGEPIGIMSSEENDTEDDVVKWFSVWSKSSKKTKKEAKYTKKALIVAKRLGIDIKTISSPNTKITEKDVLNSVQKGNGVIKSVSDKGMDLVNDVYTLNKAEQILVVGGGDGAVQILDALSGSTTQRAAGIVDDNPELKNKFIMNTPVLGKIDVKIIQAMHKNGLFDAAVISISTNIIFRSKIYQELEEAGIPFANVVHTTCHLGQNSTLGSGNIILAFSHIGSCAQLGNNNFLSAYTSIEHHSILGNGCSFGPGVLTSSSVKLGDRVKCGTGIFIEPFVEIGSDCIIASGTTLTNSVPAKHIIKSKSKAII
jgi:acetyltransferase-like isoleucine patch superfamily enzyme